MNKEKLTHAAVAIFALGAVVSTLAEGTTATPIPEPRMKAYLYHNYGSPNVLRIEEVTKPVPKDDQVLVKVRAVSLNPLDWHYMRGKPYLIRAFDSGLLRPTNPRLGVDLSGEVEAVGKKVTDFKPGDNVFGHRYGAFAEYICATEKALVFKPSNVSFEEAAAVPIAGVTALQGLRDKGQLKRGQKVLINGASGGVGTFAVQIAKALGADVTGVCSTRNIDLVRSLGADHVIDYTKEDFTKNGQRYDLILDMVSSHPLSEMRKVMTPHGALVLVGSTDVGDWLKPLGIMLKPAVAGFFGSQKFGSLLAEITKENLNALRELMQTGKLKPVIDRTYTFGQLPDAMRYLEEGHTRGKVVVTVSAGDEALPVNVTSKAQPVNTTWFVFLVGAIIVLVLTLPLVAALALNRRYQHLNPGKRPYRWGYYFSILAVIDGLVLGYILEAGLGVFVICALLYGVLAWFFAQRRHWAWIALTLLSFNPVIWVVNLVYLWKRWTEPTAGARIL
ncbi:MAG TPA: zinc-binding dehydrogenase [Chthoniobacterales bacterium]|jgi:NADPH:quinone reductase-like Zn-dependent oxidoreductase